MKCKVGQHYLIKSSQKKNRDWDIQEILIFYGWKQGGTEPIQIFVPSTLHLVIASLALGQNVVFQKYFSTNEFDSHLNLNIIKISLNNDLKLKIKS